MSVTSEEEYLRGFTSFRVGGIMGTSRTLLGRSQGKNGYSKTVVMLLHGS